MEQSWNFLGKFRYSKKKSKKCSRCRRTCMFGVAIYTSVVLNDTCDTVLNCAIGLLNAILGVLLVIIEKIDSHENKITKETKERSE